MDFVKGRGAGSNDTGRFEKLQITEDEWSNFFIDDEGQVERQRSNKTEFFKDTTRNILSTNDSPDIPFTYSVNPYRGCEHGCIYCYARPTHEYLGLSAGKDFETKIFVKDRAPELLREKLMSKNWQPEMISISGVTDCYQPIERKFRLTRGLLEVLNEFKNPVGLITKNALVTRDVDILSEMAKDKLVVVYLSVTTMDAQLATVLEPRTSAPLARLKAIETLNKAGVPVGVNVAPVIPGLNDHEIPAILKAAREAGARFAGHVILRLPYSVKHLFIEWLKTHYPDRKDKVLNFIRGMRDGQLNLSEFGKRMSGDGAQADNIHDLFTVFKKKFGYSGQRLEIRTDLFRRPPQAGDQMSLDL